MGKSVIAIIRHSHLRIVVRRVSLYWGCCMAKGELSCYCGVTKGALAVLVDGKRVGLLCSDCARDLYALRAFIIAAGWVYGWPVVKFAPLRDFSSGAAQVRLLGIIGAERARAVQAKEARLDRRLAWAVGPV